jgi:hypothetical protein
MKHPLITTAIAHSIRCSPFLFQASSQHTAISSAISMRHTCRPSDEFLGIDRLPHGCGIERTGYGLLIDQDIERHCQTKIGDEIGALR